MTRSEIVISCLQSSLKDAQDSYAYRLNALKEEVARTLEEPADTRQRSQGWIDTYARTLSETAARIESIRLQLDSVREAIKV
jgi:hypothetical protein